MYTIGLIIIFISFILIIVMLLRNEFIDLSKIFVNYRKVFKDNKLILPFFILPMMLGKGLGLIYSINKDLLIQILVVLSIILSMLFAMFSIIISKDYSHCNDIKKDKVTKVVMETENVILFEVIISVILMILIIIDYAINDYIVKILYLNIAINSLLYSLLIFVFLNLLIIMKRIGRLIDIKMKNEK